MQINWQELTSKNYWLGIDRLGMHLTDKVILFFGLGLIALAITLWILRRFKTSPVTTQFYSRLISVFFTVGLLEGLWFVLRSQYVNTLGTRLAALIIGLVGLAFLIKPLKYFIFNYRQDLTRLSKEQLKQKYLQKR